MNESLGGTIADIYSYHYSMILIRTKTKHVFGAFITAFPILTNAVQFSGTDDSFVFSVDKDDALIYNSSGKNQYYMISQRENLTIGSKGDGPAIFLDN